MYFKLLKAMMWMMLLGTFCSSPLYYMYSRGKVADQAPSLLDKFLAAYSLGNVGESSVRCSKENVRYHDNMKFFCPEDSQIAYLKDFGLESKFNSTAICPS